ncbi:protease inhibitor I42 family protein [Sinomonas sp. G460-2]|uniref:protease inhibitor I42 family protein n=1 Tax=Sinomonas sp. G460-2 TaxID=3393464 RepID=UPI0039EE9378
METAHDSSETREVEAGAEFSVDLSRSGGAGYRWEIAGLPDGVAVTSHSLMPDGTTAASPPTPGAPIVQRFAVRATASGTITFRLKRPWEDHAVRTHTVEVRIRDEPRA